MHARLNLTARKYDQNKNLLPEDEESEPETLKKTEPEKPDEVDPPEVEAKPEETVEDDFEARRTNQTPALVSR
jgi:hypothetical protein